MSPPRSRSTTSTYACYRSPASLDEPYRFPGRTAKLKQILERLELGLLDHATGEACCVYGRGSNNVLFIACELLLLGKGSDGLPLLLIKEPEAHLHPQRQLQLMEFLESAAQPSAGLRPVQIPDHAQPQPEFENPLAEPGANAAATGLLARRGTDLLGN